MKYRKKPVVIDAVQWTGKNFNEILGFVDKQLSANGLNEIFIETLEGSMKASSGDFIIKGLKGEFYPCKPDIFEASYEKVEG